MRDVPYDSAGAAGAQSGNPDLQRLRERQRVHGGRVQDLRGAPEAAQSEHTDHHVRHQPAVRFRGSVSGSELPRVPKVHQHVRPVQQGVDQGEDIRPAATSRGDHRLEERAPLGSASQSPSAKPSLLCSEFSPGDVKPSNNLTSGTSYVFISLFPPFS